MITFTRAPNDVLRSESLTPVEKVVYLVIASHLDNDNGMGAWPSRATIAREANVSVRTVANAINSLRGAGVLTWTTRKRAGTASNDSNAYDLPLQQAIANAQAMDNGAPPDTGTETTEAGAGITWGQVTARLSDTDARTFRGHLARLGHGAAAQYPADQ
ncbi:MAG: helix-turn-helix domain-containing protein, partial [Thermomicrobiales bacterium]